MPTGVTYVDQAVAAYAPLGLKYSTDEAADEAAREGLYVCTGGAVTASATQGKLDLAVGTDYAATTELTYTAQTAQPGCLTGISTTVAAGSNGQTVTGLTSGQLVVGSTGGGAPGAGLAAVVRAGAVISCIAWTSIVDGTHFGGVSLVSGWPNITFASATDTIVVINNDLTAFKWLDVEVDSAGPYQTAVGSAGSSTTALKPALTASRTLHASLLLQPVSGNTSALSIDALLTTANGKSKLVEARRGPTAPHGSRVISSQAAGSNVTNPTSLTSLCSGSVSTVSLPANSLSVGDVIDIDVLIYDTNNAGTSAREYQIVFGSVASFDFTTLVTLGASAFGRIVRIKNKVVLTASGFKAMGDFAITNATVSGNDNAEAATTQTAPSQTLTSAVTIDVKGKYGTSSSGATMAILAMTVTKYPVQ